MIVSDNPETTRQVFFEAWAKTRNQQPLTPLEDQIVRVIQVHPEYHGFLEGKETFDLGGLENPFLHLGLHLAVREQVATDRPAGIRQIYRTLAANAAGNLLQEKEVEHRMMACLSEVLWSAQQQRVMPDEQRYLTLLKNLVKQEE